MRIRECPCCRGVDCEVSSELIGVRTPVDIHTIRFKVEEVARLECPRCGLDVTGTSRGDGYTFDLDLIRQYTQLYNEHGE